MDKRGQVTIFVILAILIVGAVIAVFAFRGERNVSSSVPIEVVPVKNFVDSCLERVSEEVVYSVGEGGGYLFPSNLTTSDGVNYIYYEGKNHFQTISQMESEISKGVSDGMIFCVKDFSDFSDYEINYTVASVSSDIQEDSVFISLNYPMSIGKGSSTYVLKDFGTYELKVRLGLIHDLVDKFLKENYYDEGEVCIDCVLQEMYSNNMTMEIYNLNSTDVFFIQDNSDENSFSFNFANKRGTPPLLNSPVAGELLFAFYGTLFKNNNFYIFSFEHFVFDDFWRCLN